MELVLQRTRLNDTHTNGQLYIDGEYFCFTLEDVMREVDGQKVESWKIKGETAIPTGVYKVTLEQSPRFGPETPTLHDVPGFSNIRIHTGNIASDTEGCLIVGFSLGPNGIIRPGSTRPALSALKQKLRNQSNIIIRIFNPV